MSVTRCRSMDFALNTVACALATMGFLSSCSFLLATRIFPSLRLKLPLRVKRRASGRASKRSDSRPSKPALKTCLTEQRCTFRNGMHRGLSRSSSPSPEPLEGRHPSIRRSSSSPPITDKPQREPSNGPRLRPRPLSDPSPFSVKFISAAKRISNSPKLSVFPMKRECTSAHARACSTGEADSEVEEPGDPKRFKAVRRQTIGFETHLKKTTDSLARFQRRASRTLSMNENWDKSTLLRPFVDRRNTRMGVA